MFDVQPKKKKFDASTVCGFCLGTADCNKDGEEEELISCADCGNSGKVFLGFVGFLLVEYLGRLS